MTPRLGPGAPGYADALDDAMRLLRAAVDAELSDKDPHRALLESAVADLLDRPDAVAQTLVWLPRMAASILAVFADTMAEDRGQELSPERRYRAVVEGLTDFYFGAAAALAEADARE